MKKRILSLLLALVMMLGILPGAALAAEDSITVYVTISNKGVFAEDTGGNPMAYRPVTVTDRDGNGIFSIYDAYYAAHSTYCESDFALDGSGLVGELWGSHGSFLTYVNDAGISGAPLKTQEISNGDHLVGAILADDGYNWDYYSYFDQKSLNVEVGEEFTLTLKGASHGMGDAAASAMSKMNIGIWNNGSFSQIDSRKTDNSGQVTLSFNAGGTYYVTANGKYNYTPIITPVCVVTVPDTKTDAEHVSDDKAALKLEYTDGENLTLPSVGAGGMTTITWASGNTAIVSDAGVVTRPRQSTEVTMTATITLGLASETREFKFTVLSRLDAAKAALDSDTLKPEEFTGRNGSSYAINSTVDDTNILTLAQEIVNAVDSGVTVALDESLFEAGEVIGDGGAITYPKTGSAKVTVPFTLTLDGDSVKHSVEVTVPKHAQTKQEAIDALKAAITWDQIKNKNTSQDSVKTELKLPGGKSTALKVFWTVTPGSDALTIGAWSSSSCSNNVTQPKYGQQDVTLTLTATMDYREATVIAAGPMPNDGSNVVSFDITIPALTEEEYNAIMSEMDTALAGAAEKITIAKGTYASSTAADLSSVTDNLHLDNLLKTTNGYTTVWTSENSAITKPSNGTGVAAVACPPAGQDAVKGKLTVTLSKCGYTKFKSFDVTVPAWSEDIADEKQAKVDFVANALDFTDIKGSNAADAAAGVTKKLSLPKEAELDGNSVTFATYANNARALYKVTWTSSPDGIIGSDGSLTLPNSDTPVTLTATVALKTPLTGVEAKTQDISITVTSRGEVMMNSIASGYTNRSTEWEVLEMAAYNDTFPSAAAKTSDTAKQTLINNVVNMISTGQTAGGQTAGAGDYAKAILALTAAGIDPDKLYPVNSNTPVSAVDALDEVAATATSPWTAPFILATYQLSDTDSDTHEDTLISALLSSQLNNGCWSEYGTIDTTANVLASLSFHTHRQDVRTAIEKGIAYLSGAQKSNGAFDDGQEGLYAAGINSNSTAMVIVALAANGINPDTDSRFIKSGNSALDGLFSFATSKNTGFGQTDGSAVNNYATEQSFRALIAAHNVMTTAQAYNVYDHSGKTLAPGRATGTGTVITPSDPTGGDITVNVSVKSDTGYWLTSKAVTIPGDGATVYHALVKALEGSGITQVGAGSGYVSSMTYNGKTLGEFSSGENSGWMYKLNNVLIQLGLTECTVADGDSIVWFYTEDWTSVPGATVMDPGKDENKDGEDDGKDESVTFTDVAGHWGEKSINFVVEKGLFNGVGDGLFAPDESMTRAMLVTSLYRLDGAGAAGSCIFPDVSGDIWYADAAAWAGSNGIVNGIDGKFDPEANITRQQIATILYRYAVMLGIDTFDTGNIGSFADGNLVASWAEDAMSWAVGAGLFTGRDGDLAPADTATRAEVATVYERFISLIEK